MGGGEIMEVTGASSPGLVLEGTPGYNCSDTPQRLVYSAPPFPEASGCCEGASGPRQKGSPVSPRARGLWDGKREPRF